MEEFLEKLILDLFLRDIKEEVFEQIRDSIVVSIPACHAGDPGSIPGHGVFFHLSFFATFIFNSILILSLI